jgi:hypothetical protein
MSIENWWNDMGRKNEALRENSVPMPLCPPQIPYGLAWDQTWTWCHTKSWYILQNGDIARWVQVMCFIYYYTI